MPINRNERIKISNAFTWPVPTPYFNCNAFMKRAIATYLQHALLVRPKAKTANLYGARPKRTERCCHHLGEANMAAKYAARAQAIGDQQDEQPDDHAH